MIKEIETQILFGVEVSDKMPYTFLIIDCDFRYDEIIFSISYGRGSISS